jgi:hypothetical protein
MSVACCLDIAPEIMTATATSALGGSFSAILVSHKSGNVWDSHPAYFRFCL